MHFGCTKCENKYSEGALVYEFDYEAAINKIILGGTDEDGNKDPYMITFIFNSGMRYTLKGIDVVKSDKEEKDNKMCSYTLHSTDRSPVRLVMYDDRLELENPGGLYGRITVNDLGKASADTRNPYMAGALEIMIDTENRFSGIPTVALLHVLGKNLQKKLDLKHQLILLRPILVHC